MQPPLTGAQAIEVRRAWRKRQWRAKYPDGEWRVVRQQRHYPYTEPPYWVVVLVHIVETDFNGYDRLTHEDTIQWPTTARMGYGNRPYYHRTGAGKHKEWKFTNRGDAYAKFNEIKDWINANVESQLQ